VNKNLIIPTTLLYDFMHLRFISAVFEKLTWNEVKFLNLANGDKIASGLNICFLQVNVDDRKSVKVDGLPPRLWGLCRRPSRRLG
jgi:hypothetical protein